MTTDIVAVAIMMAISLSAMLAWDFGRRWLAEQSSMRGTIEQLAQFSARLDEHERVQKQLAEDWLKKFRQLEGDWRKLKEHADSQIAGSLAQLTSQQTRGFNR